MKRDFLFAVTLLLLLTVWTMGCSRGPTTPKPAGEPVTAQTQGVEPQAAPEKGDEESDQEPTPTTELQREEATMTSPPTPEPTEVISPPEADGMVRLAREDLAQKLDLTPEAIRLVSVEAVDWPDASLGCPQPGMMYAQVITPGFRVVLEAQGERYEYHTDMGRFVVLCTEQPQSEEGFNSNTEQGSSQGGESPIFVEMVQISLLAGSAPQMSLTDVGPNGVFAFNPSGQTLLLQPSITVAPSAEVLIGLTTVIQSPNRTYVTGELFQVPPSEAAPLTVVAVEADTGSLTLAYAGKAFTLAPGQSRSFKQRETDQTATEITTITNYGRLAAISPLSTDLGVR